MSDSYTTVRSDLRAILLAVPGIPAVAWESRPFTPSIGVAYVEERLIPLGAPVTTHGNSGWIKEDFIYQITLHSPFNETGLFEHENLAGAIRVGFFPGLKIGGGINSFAGMLQEVRRGPVSTSPDWRFTIIDVDGYFHRSARVA